jgi:AcrR family transcriptional regulator
MIDDIEKIIHPSSDKIIAIYQAVLELLEEGCDTSSLKVIDITNRAGIGKGTAYEYFRSKDEIILSAILYSLHQAIEEGNRQLEAAQTFYDKFMTLLSFVEGRGTGKICENIKRFLPYWTYSHRKLEDFQQKFSYFEQYYAIVQEILQGIYQAGVKENLFSDNRPTFIINSVFATQIMIFLRYLEKPKSADCSIEEFKKYLYENIVYLLR